MKPLGNLFIKPVRMMIEPIIFTTVVVGLAKMGDMKEVARVGRKAIVYFEGDLDSERMRRVLFDGSSEVGE